MTKNRIIAMLLAAVLVLSFVVVPDAVNAAGEYTVKLSDASGNSVVTAQAGDTVTLKLSIENNPGIIAVGVTLAYPQGLSLTKAEVNANDMMTMYMQYKFIPSFTNSETYNTNPYLVWMNQATGTTEKKLVTYNGNFCDVTFKIADDAQPGDYKITLAAPADKNTTAGVDGSGVILNNTNTPITNVAVVDCTIRIESDECAHQWGAWTDKPGEAADCENPGKQVRECGLCHETEEKDVPAKQHSFTNYTETTGATCITNAKETATCDNGCGETDEREVANSATGEHSFQGQPYISNNDATCLADGTHYRECSVDGCNAKEAATQDVGSKLEHSYTGTALTYPATEANCHAPATYYHVCVNGCGGQGTMTFEHGSINASNHDGETQLRGAEPATEEAPGYTGDLWCLGCNTIIEPGSPIDQLDHTHNMVKTTANGKTCTTNGNIEYYTCTKCNKLYNDENGTLELQLADTVIPASHELTRTAAQGNSCTEPGNIEYYSCSVCSKKFTDAAGTNEVADVTIPAAGHNMNRTAPAAPDCTNTGNYEYYTCQTCHKLYEDAQGNTETNATAVIRPATGHAMEHVMAKGKGCTTDGNIEHYACDTCNKLYADIQGNTQLQPEDVVIPAGHELTRTATQGNSCTEPGNIEYYSCSVCSKKFTDAAGTNEVADVTIPAAGHNMNRTAPAAPDCTNTGNYEYYTCQTCHKLYEDAQGNTETNATAVIRPATGHAMEHVMAKGKDCTTDGNIEHYVCDTCNKLYADIQGATELQPEDVVIPAGHELTKTPAQGNSCTTGGNIEYYTCSVCEKIYSDAEATTEITEDDIAVDAKGHLIGKVEAKPAGCTDDGHIEHYACSNGCGELYADAEGTEKLEAADVVIEAKGHNLTKHEAVAATTDKEGNILYYTCDTCEKLLAEDKETVIEAEDTVVPKLPTPEAETPAAGDNFDVSLCIAFMLLACLSLALTVVVRKKTIR